MCSHTHSKTIGKPHQDKMFTWHVQGNVSGLAQTQRLTVYWGRNGLRGFIDVPLAILLDRDTLGITLSTDAFQYFHFVSFQIWPCSSRCMSTCSQTSQVETLQE